MVGSESETVQKVALKGHADSAVNPSLQQKSDGFLSEFVTC